ncbi:MAG: hypothetical protein AAGF11_39555 [Myxococcota bacterium]
MHRHSETFSLLLPLSLGLLLAGCIDNGNSGDESNVSSGEQSTGNDPDPTPTTGDVPDADSTTGDAPDPDPTTGDAPSLEEQLEGRWISQACELLPQADGSTLYFMRDFTLDIRTWSITATIYGDDLCSVPLLTLDIGGDYRVAGESEVLFGVHEADFDRSVIALTPHVQDFVDWFDAEGCGTAPWAIGEGQDVTETGCAFVPSSEVCPIEYDLISLTDEDHLLFGQRPIDGDMCSPRTRPTALGEDPVTRQD